MHARLGEMKLHRVTPKVSNNSSLACGSHPRLRGDHITSRQSWHRQHGSPPPARGPPSRTGTPRPRSPAHPRLRGDHSRVRSVGSIRGGSPPPARGPPFRLTERSPSSRLTPACAGTTGRVRTAACRRAAHPRLRGDHESLGFASTYTAGSPPPARGPLTRPVRLVVVARLTPACAGTTREARGPGPRPPAHPACAGTTMSRLTPTARTSAHPRLRGDHVVVTQVVRTVTGSPPPARGLRELGQLGAQLDRLTPACAGTTTRSASPLTPWSAHPRLRGDHGRMWFDSTPGHGSPPPARGPRPRRHRHRAPDRLTPACAGTTSVRPVSSPPAPAHPRLRGDHRGNDELHELRCGSPPPARGPRVLRVPALRACRLTPACAGTT